MRARGWLVRIVGGWADDVGSGRREGISISRDLETYRVVCIWLEKELVIYLSSWLGSCRTDSP